MCVVWLNGAVCEVANVLEMSLDCCDRSPLAALIDVRIAGDVMLSLVNTGESRREATTTDT